MIYEREWSNPNYEFSSYEVDSLNWHLHFHEVFEICYVTEGQMQITIDKEFYKLNKGGGVIIFPRQLHRYESVGNSKMSIITFMPSLVPEFTNRYKNVLPVNNLLPDIEKYSGKLSPQNIVAKKGLAYSILGDLIDNTEFKDAAVSYESKLLIKVLRFVENNYMNDCSLGKAASELSYGYTYLSRMFKQYMQMSYNEYLNKYRINRAVYMLSNEKDVPIQEIAAKCGYDNLCSFNRNFKAITGTIPSEMIKRDTK